MKTKEDTSLTPKESLLFWTAHGLICASPSFVVAVNLEYNTLATISAMLLGTILLILLYTWLSLRTPVSIDTKYGLFASSIRWAAHLRALFSLLSLPVILSSQGVDSYNPIVRLLHVTSVWLDIIPGYGAVQVTGLLFPTASALQYQSRIKFIPEFFPTLVTTLITGIIFSIIFFFFVMTVGVIIAAYFRVNKK